MSHAYHWHYKPRDKYFITGLILTMKESAPNYSLKSNLRYIFAHVSNQLKKLGIYLSFYTISKTALILLNVITTKIILEILFQAFTPQNALIAVLLLAVGTFAASTGETIS